MDQTTKDQIWSHLNVLLLVFLFLCAGFMLLHSYRYYGDHANFVEQMTGQILAALLALLTSAKLVGSRAGDVRNGQKPSDGPNPSPAAPNAPEGQQTPSGGN